MASSVPKQFMLLAGVPVLMHTVRAFREALPEAPVTLVLPEDQFDTWALLCREHSFGEPHRLVAGGDTRYRSVKNALATLESDGLVAIHDGVRPLIRRETILRLMEEAALHGCAVPVVAPSDSLRWQDDAGNHVIDRNRVKLIQTPQVFPLNKLKAAYVQEYDESFTDDATVWERAGNPVHLTEGQADNLKITRPEDLAVAEALWNVNRDA